LRLRLWRVSRLAASWAALLGLAARALARCCGVRCGVLPCAPPPRRPRWGLRGALSPFEWLRPRCVGRASRAPLAAPPRAARAAPGGVFRPGLQSENCKPPLDRIARACYIWGARPVAALRGPPVSCTRVSMHGKKPPDRKIRRFLVSQGIFPAVPDLLPSLRPPPNQT